MPVNTRKVVGRREVRFESYHDLLHDAERLAAGDARLLGNWSLGQIFAHLSRNMEMSIDGASFKAPLPVRVVARLFMKQRFLQRPMPPGFRLPASAAEMLVAEATETEQGLAALRSSVLRLQSETERAAHPLLGELSLNEWDRLHMRHAELHLSFAIPRGVPAAVR